VILAKIHEKEIDSMKGRTLSYQELMARREKRRADEVAFAMRRPPIPNHHGVANKILLLQWMIDELYKEWREMEIARAQEQKTVLRPQRSPGRRGGRKNSILEQLGLA
jgi:hypothetical protein